ncbi:hypothetical protein DM01DRAFT_1331471 [Hesseltinella vesiculosa]|uniref:DUF4604 domain-containing protein n=1 Tax=Hesseltinella vesiculosa TaxID=101127 RepID=A0A1X2GWL5_9FUNG|nr:hypothetical protein DM01DRAFT_1331471 [Hesseltinella vesiculosa]
MPPKRGTHTPHQLSQGLSYVHKEPAFLARLKGNAVESERAKRKFPDHEDGQDDEDVDELEGAQVVELDSQGREIHKDVGEKDDDEDHDDQNDGEEKEPGPSVDENGRLLFRPRKKTKSSKQALEDAIDAHKASKEKTTDKPAKDKKKKKNAPIALSFDPEE